jgi:hypothetical protein
MPDPLRAFVNCPPKPTKFPTKFPSSALRRQASWRMLDPSSTPSASPVPILKPLSVDDPLPYVAMRGEGTTQY